MTTASKNLYRYVRNADRTKATGAARLSDGQVLELGGDALEIPEADLARLAALGIVVEAVAADEVPDEPDAPKALEDMSEEELKQTASDEGVDISGLRRNAQIAERIQAERVKREEGEGLSSLPATAPGAVAPGTTPPSGPSA